MGEVNFTVKNLFAIRRSFGDHDSLRIAQKRRAPKFQAVSAFRRRFMADTVYGCDINPVCDGVATVNVAPGITLSLSIRFFLAGMPAYGSGIKEDHSTVQRGDPRPFRIPLVPANQSRDFSSLRAESPKSKVTGGKVEFFIVGGIVGNVHFAVNTCDLSVCINDRSGIVVDAGGSPLEQRCDDNCFCFFGDSTEGFGRGTGDGFGKVEITRIFALAEILRLK